MPLTKQSKRYQHAHIREFYKNLIEKIEERCYRYDRNNPNGYWRDDLEP